FAVLAGTGNRERWPVAPAGCSNKHSCKRLPWFRQCGWDLAPYTSELRGCPCRSIGFNGHNTTSTDYTVTLIVGCARNSASVPRLNVLRRSTVNGPTPARHLGEVPFLICNDIKYTPPAGCRAAPFISYLQLFYNS